MDSLDKMILSIPLHEALLVIEKAGLQSEIEHTAPPVPFAGGIKRVVRVRQNDDCIQILVVGEQQPKVDM